MKRHRRARFAAAGVLGAALVAFAVLARPGGGPGAGADVAPGLNTAAANVLQLDLLSPADQYPAPSFQLVDQYGQAVSPSRFRGRAVVVSFNDDRCTDLCTFLAQDIVAADEDLGRASGQVVFLAVNVNPFYPGARWVRAWSDEHGLGAVRNWLFATGSPARLEPVWKHYGVYVGLDRKDRTVVHGTQLFFVGPAGKVAAIGDFGDNAASTSLFAHAMAQMAVDLLPAGRRPPVGGAVPLPTRSDATVGAPAPPFRLPELGRPGRVLSSASLAGHYAVLDFWSSTCTACAQQLPVVEQAYRALGSKARFVGVDVSDPPQAGAAFAHRAGATYPMVSDAQGSLAGAYRVPGLPFAVVLGPNGVVLVRHPGVLSLEQLEYVVKTEVPGLGGG